MAYYTRFFIYLAIVAAGLIVGSLHYSKDNRKILPVVFILGFVFISQTISLLMAKYLRNNVPMEHVILFVSTILWGWFYYENIEEKRSRLIVKYATISLAIFSLLNTAFLQDINTFPDNTFKLATFFNLVFGAMLFVQLLDLPGKQNVFKNPYFLVALAVVWFNIISSFYFFLRSFLIRHELRSSIVGTIHWGSNIVYYITILIAMIFLKKHNQNVRKIRL